MPSIDIDLPQDLVGFIDREVAAGRYSSNSDVVTEALRLLRHELAEALEALRREVQIGLDDAAAGRFSKKSVAEIAQEVLDESQGE